MSHVTVSGVWRQWGTGVTCYGFWVLELRFGIKMNQDVVSNMARLVGWSVGCLIGWSVDCSVAARLLGWLVSWLVGQMSTQIDGARK